MFSLEPPRTPYDVHFNVFGIPTRIHPGFWLVSFILGFSASQGGTKPLPVLIFIGVEFISILVHELGHALTMRRYGYAPRIVLYHLGGLAIRELGFAGGFERRRTREDTRSSILISLAGPGAGFLLAAVVVVLVFVARGAVTVRPDYFPAALWKIELPEGTPDAVFDVVHFFLFINIFWGLVNLMPVLPLDGGQVARELLTHRDPYHGLTQTLQLSIGAGIVAAAAGWAFVDYYVGIMFALLAFSNYLTLQQMGQRY